MRGSRDNYGTGRNRKVVQKRMPLSSTRQQSAKFDRKFPTFKSRENTLNGFWLQLTQR